MGSIVNGLAAGALVAGYVAMQYGDSPDGFAVHVRDFLSRTVGASIERATGDGLASMHAAPDTQDMPTAEAIETQPDEVPEAVPAMPTLEARWAAFAAGPTPVPAAAEYPWRHCFRRAAAAHDLPESLLLAVASGESGFDSSARSAKDAIGLMQIRWPQTGNHLGIHREADLYDPCTNVDAGARYLRELLAQYGDDLHLSLAAYNYGPSRISGELIPEGARWYSQYIYQHLQQVLGGDHVPTSKLLGPGVATPGGHLVLMRFNRPQRARDFLRFLQGQVPDLDVQQQSESLGQQEIVLLYRDQRDRDRSLALLSAAGLDPLVVEAKRSHAL